GGKVAARFHCLRHSASAAMGMLAGIGVPESSSMSTRTLPNASCVCHQLNAAPNPPALAPERITRSAPGNVGTSRSRYAATFLEPTCLAGLPPYMTVLSPAWMSPVQYGT